MFEIGNIVSIRIVSGAFKGLWFANVAEKISVNNRGVMSYRYGVFMEGFPVETPIYYFNENELRVKMDKNVMINGYCVRK